jgi:hypothetical protein
MDKSMTNLIGASFWVIGGPFFIWKPHKVLKLISRSYKLMRGLTPFPPKDEYFDVRPQTVKLARILVGIIWFMSLIGFYLNLMEIITKAG